MALVDVIAPSDFVLGSPIGRADGEVRGVPPVATGAWPESVAGPKVVSSLGCLPGTCHTWRAFWGQSEKSGGVTALCHSSSVVLGTRS